MDVTALSAAIFANKDVFHCITYFPGFFIKIGAKSSRFFFAMIYLSWAALHAGVTAVVPVVIDGVPVDWVLDEGDREVVVDGVLDEGDREVVVIVDWDLGTEDGANCALTDCITIAFVIKETNNTTAKVIPIDEKNNFMWYISRRIYYINTY